MFRMLIDQSNLISYSIFCSYRIILVITIQSDKNPNNSNKKSINIHIFINILRAQRAYIEILIKNKII